ncbi:MAG: hypothetical protein ACFCD0_23930 [Gemmataceae bacterium]
MGLNTFALTCLSLLVAQTPNDAIFMKTRSFNLPYGIAPEQRAKIRAVRLYVSRDRGRSWSKELQIRPDDTKFPFFAEKDGEYWFRITVVDHSNQEFPRDIEQGPPPQKVIVDTLPPRVEITSAKREGEHVVVSWKLLERNTDWNTLELRYKPNGPYVGWQTVPKFPQQAQGTMKFRVDTAQAIVMRLQLRDQAQNLSFSEKVVASVDGTLNRVSYRQEGTIRGQSVPSVAPPTQNGGKSGSPSFQRKLPPPQPPESFENKQFNSEAVPPPPEPKNVQPRNVQPRNVQPKINKSEGLSITSEANSQDSKARSSPATAKQEKTENAGPLIATPQKQLPPIKYINTPELMLRYEISKIGKSGVGKVGLYVTEDGGYTWKQMAEDPSVVGMEMTQQVHTRLLRLPGEGVYGFTLRIWSGAGKGRPAPKPGEVPEMRVELDYSKPFVELYDPMPDQERKNTLLLQWRARDKNLVSLPIALEYAEHAEGPWATIHNNLPNTGKYPWTLPPNFPAKVFIRVKARDKAGNVGLSVTDQPQTTDLISPQYRLLDIAPTAQKH